MDSIVAIQQPCTDQAAESWLDSHARDLRDGRGFHFAVTGRCEPDSLIGYTALTNVNRESEEAQLGFWVGYDFAGKGYASEAARGVVHFAFSTLLLNRVAGYHKRRNDAARKVLEKASMQKEGILRQRVRENHTFQDVAVWSILREEWLEDFDYAEFNVEIEKQESLSLS